MRVELIWVSEIDKSEDYQIGNVLEVEFDGDYYVDSKGWCFSDYNFIQLDK